MLFWLWHDLLWPRGQKGGRWGGSNFFGGFFLLLRYFFVCVMDLVKSYYAEKEGLADDGNGIDRAVINVLLFLGQISSKPIKN